MANPRRAIYPGSFDPITNGHVDIIRRLFPLYDEIIVLVANSASKNYMFTAEERRSLIQETLSDLQNVRVEVHDGLTVDFAKKVDSPVIIRGLRALSDFEYEMAMANMNKHLDSGIETLIVFADPKFGHVSSRLVKEVSKYAGELHGLVPESVLNAILKKTKQ